MRWRVSNPSEITGVRRIVGSRLDLADGTSLLVYPTGGGLGASSRARAMLACDGKWLTTAGLVLVRQPLVICAIRASTAGNLANSWDRPAGRVGE